MRKSPLALFFSTERTWPILPSTVEIAGAKKDADTIIKGYGFVIRENGDEIFVHQRSIRQVGEGDNRRRPMLRDGQAVSFVVATRDKGAQAEDVTTED